MKSKYFKPYELVSKKVYEKYSEDTIMNRMNPLLLELLEWIRENVGFGLVINNWKSGGNFQQRGYRSNLDQIIKDATMKGHLNFSAHALFMAADMNPVASSGKSALYLWNWIHDNAANAPCNFRMENKTATVNSRGEVSWVHVDVATEQKTDKSKPSKVIVFNP